MAAPCLGLCGLSPYPQVHMQGTVKEAPHLVPWRPENFSLNITSFLHESGMLPSL